MPRLRIRMSALFATVGARGGIKMKAADSPGGARGTNGRITGKRTMSQLADLLSAVLQRPVVDQTGLTGPYEFTLQWLPESGLTGQNAPQPPDPSAASIFTALQEQLGLQLQSTKAPVDVLVIDHAERPDPN